MTHDSWFMTYGSNNNNSNNNNNRINKQQHSHSLSLKLMQMDGSIVGLLQIVRAERAQRVEPVEAEHVTGLMFWRVHFPFLKDRFSWKHLKLWACLCRYWHCPKWPVRLTQWLQDSVPWIESYHFIHRHSDNDKAKYDDYTVFRSLNSTKNTTLRTMGKCSFRGIERRQKRLGIALKQLELQVSVSHFVLTTQYTTRSFFSLPSSKSHIVWMKLARWTWVSFNNNSPNPSEQNLAELRHLWLLPVQAKSSNSWRRNSQKVNPFWRTRSTEWLYETKIWLEILASVRE